MTKNPPANAGATGDTGSAPGWEDPLEKEMATHSSILAWEIPLAEEIGVRSPRGRKESDMTERLNTPIIYTATCETDS